MPVVSVAEKSNLFPKTDVARVPIALPLLRNLSALTVSSRFSEDFAAERHLLLLRSQKQAK